MLCDSLVQCGREFTDVDAKPETEIRFGEISDHPNVIKIMLQYYNPTENIKDIKSKYFNPVLDVLDSKKRCSSTN